MKLAPALTIPVLTALALLATPVLASPAAAQEDFIIAPARTTALAELGALISQNYFDAEMGARIDAEINALASDPDFAHVTSANILAAELTERLQAHDRSFEVSWHGVEEIVQARSDQGLVVPVSLRDSGDVFLASTGYVIIIPTATS